MVALLGRGGMGEIFRADDLKLGQPVALKLLPSHLSSDDDRRARLLGEVRLARQIAHPNVCRVYDVGEVDGEHFITMEYVQGEDLASLLQRIGRLPSDKAIEISRQICAGLAAAHERGILHRDLKPANVMLDERGKVRVTDFGLAVLSSDRGVSASEGTPAYMAPEQIAGKEATTRSDIYSLGLVLYEIFTGRRAFSAASLAELRDLREQRSLTDPSRIVPDLDPAIERVILRCLETDPLQRPGSVAAVAAALPGGDPLAAAVAAGETPSPELLAAAGDSVGLRPSLALPLLLFTLIGAVVVVLLGAQRHIGAFVDFELRPEALEQKGRELLRQFGYAEPAADSAGGFEQEKELIRHIETSDRSAGRWKALGNERPPAVTFWYREAARPLEWRSYFSNVITPDDPAPVEPGMKQVSLDPSGRLVHLRVVPQSEAGSGGLDEADWGGLLLAAGLDPSALRREPPRTIPPMYADARAAWSGTSPTGKPLRIEAASLGGRPVYFRMTGPWQSADGTGPAERSRRKRIAEGVLIAMLGLIVAGAIVIGRRNLALGRGDRRGATRVALFAFTMLLAASLLHTSHTSTTREVGVLVMAISGSLFPATIVWLLYVALEPFVRRRWPHALIGWGKALAGRFRDPHVGRDLLFGSAIGVGVALVEMAVPRIGTLAGEAPAVPTFFLSPMSSMRHVFESLFGTLWAGVGIALTLTFVIFLLRLILRRDWLAFGAFLLVAVAVGDVKQVSGLVVTIILYSAVILTLVRFGLLSAGAVIAVSSWSVSAAAPIDMWYGYIVWLPLCTVAALALYAFHVSLAGRPILREALLES
jgi:predicted Ser/Thr protein kinase